MNKWRRTDLDCCAKASYIFLQLSMIFSVFLLPRCLFWEIENFPDFCWKSRLREGKDGALTNCSVEAIARNCFFLKSANSINISTARIEIRIFLSPSGDLGIGLVWNNLSNPITTTHFLVQLLESSSNWTKLSMMGPQLFSGWYQMILDVFRCNQLFSDVLCCFLMFSAWL